MSRKIIISSEKDKINVITDNFHFYKTFWFWVSCVELLIILLISNRLIKINKQNKINIITGDGKLSNTDMDNLINSIHQSKSLYKELNKVCHPDRFINSEKLEIAIIIFQEITENEKNYSKLLELRSRAEKELFIKFL
jgi:hypothetical protein